MTAIVSTSQIKGGIYKLRLRLGTTPPPPLGHCRLDDPYLVDGATSFNVNVTHSQEPVPEIGKQGLKYAPGLARAYGWFACFFYNEDVSPITLLKIMEMLRKAPH